MTMQKKEKIAFVKALSKELKAHKTCAVLELGATPDRLVQRLRKQLGQSARIVAARKTLMVRALSADPVLAKLGPSLDGNVALILTDMEPAELGQLVASNRTRLSAKPHQLSPDDITIEAGETAIAPGQAVTDLKAAGIDVKIEKGKVVISKGKVLVAKGVRVTVPVSKALKMLDIMPFSAATRLRTAYSSGLLFSEQAIAMDRMAAERALAEDFVQAHLLSTAIGFVTQYNAPELVKRAYLSALGLGVERNIYEPEIVERLLAKAVLEAMQANRLVKPVEAEKKDDGAAPDGAEAKKEG